MAQEQNFYPKHFTTDNIMKLIKKEKIDINPVWQRDVVWNPEGWSLLIKSVINLYPISPIILWARPNNNYVCVDGKNRICALKAFLEGDAKVQLDSGEMSSDDDIYMTYQEIKNRMEEEDDQYIRDYLELVIENFHSYPFNVVVLKEEWDEGHVQEYFQLVQEGKPLNNEEKINSIACEYVRTLRSLNDQVEQEFQTILGKQCNKRLKLYSFIANIISILPVVYTKLNSAEPKMANTNASFRNYVNECKKKEVGFTQEDEEELVSFLRKIISVVNDIYTNHKDVTWGYRTDKRKQMKPSISDYVSVAYYCNMNTGKSHQEYVDELSAKFIKLCGEGEEMDEDERRKYFLELRKNQAQYSMTNILKRHQILMEL